MRKQGNGKQGNEETRKRGNKETRKQGNEETRKKPLWAIVLIVIGLAHAANFPLS
jgi:hypothetical protein